MGLRQKVLRTVVQLAIAGAVVIGFDTTNASAADTIVNGISAGDIDLGGLTKEEAVAKVQDYVAGYTGKSVEFLVDGNSAMATIGELGYYSTKLDNCKNPKFMQSTYVNTTIKYTDEEKIVVNSQKKKKLDKKMAELVGIVNDIKIDE